MDRNTPDQINRTVGRHHPKEMNRTAGIDRGELASVRVGPRRVRIRARDLETFLDGSSAVSEPEAREVFSQALSGAQAARDDAELVLALRELSRAALELVRTLDRS